MGGFSSCHGSIRRGWDDEKKGFLYRSQAHQLFFEAGWSKRAIARHLGVSRGFVTAWTQGTAQDLTADRRGWASGRPRRWPPEVLERLVKIHHALETDPHQFFTGATAVQHAYRRRYPRSPVPSLSTIGRLLRTRGLSRPRQQRGRSRGAAAYLGYPSHTLAALDPRLIEADFIGPKYLQGQATPLTFVGFSCAAVPRIRQYYRVSGTTTDALLDACRDFLTRFEHPAVLKVDNAPATIGSGSAPRTLSRFVRFLLAQEIQPVFSVPRRPFSQASIEGNNSVFARRFWRQRHFTSLADLDRQLGWFNTASLAYTEYVSPTPTPRPAFQPRVHFLRQVREGSTHTRPGIDVLNTFVPLPQQYTQLFVLATWELDQQTLTINLETDGKTHSIKTVPFPVHRKSQM